MNNSRIALTLSITAPLFLAACSPSGNPHLDMCKKITSNLLTSSAEFGEIQETKNNREMRMVLPYNSDGVASEAVCTFASQRKGKSYATAPKAVTIDGVAIGVKDLMRASLASSKEVIKDSADEAKEQAMVAAEKAKETASEATAKAGEIAGQAKEKASDLAADARVKAEEVATQIKDSEALERAKSLADETKDKAKNVIIEGAKTIQEKLEN